MGSKWTDCVSHVVLPTAPAHLAEISSCNSATHQESSAPLASAPACSACPSRRRTPRVAASLRKDLWTTCPGQCKGTAQARNRNDTSWCTPGSARCSVCSGVHRSYPGQHNPTCLYVQGTSHIGELTFFPVFGRLIPDRRSPKKVNGFVLTCPIGTHGHPG